MATHVARQYTRLLALWPKDALRPNLPFTRAIEHRAAPYGLQPTTPAPSQSPPSASQSPPAPPPNPQWERAQLNALYSLLEDRYTKTYPLSPAVLKPASAPEHYTKLMAEIERAPRKTWWQAKLDEWKMKIRWS